MSEINQKEYLKRYLSIGKDGSEKKKKKKRKKIKNETCRIKIIDDNIDTFHNAVQEDLLGESEDAPQIVEIIDDRPPSLRIDEATKTRLWIPVGKNDDVLIDIKTEQNAIVPTKTKNDHFIKKEIEDTDQNISNSLSEIQIKEEPRSPDRLNETRAFSLNKRKDDSYSQKSSNYSSDNEQADVSPSIRQRKEKNSSLSDRKKSSHQRDCDSGDLSPPRRRTEGELSPPRKRRGSNQTVSIRDDSDMSPPRRKKKAELSPVEKIQRNLSCRDDSDMSPPRRKRKEDLSPPRRKKVENVSPRKVSRWNKSQSNSDNDMSPPRKNDHKNLPLISRKCSDQLSSSLREQQDKNQSKMLKTLDGKTAGLQNARELIEETRKIKHREDELFKNMSSSISGANAATIIRDRRTGQIRNLAEEAARDLEKKKKEDESKEKYSRWGRGLRQVEDATSKIQDEINEMSKPLARYADDEDLERYLKEQEREGDPMLAYIRKKKKKQDVEEGKPLKPEYMGEFMPNRFGIRPGHRWDGVDRSNGYEKRWFEVQNSKLASQEESYKWSTEDM